MKGRLVLNSVLKVVIQAIIIVVVLGPIYWMVSSSFKTVREIMSTAPTLFPRDFTLTGYMRLFRQGTFVPLLCNSIIISALTTVFSGVIATAAGFGTYFGRMKWLRSLKLISILAFVFPTTLLIVPIYQILVAIRAVDTVMGLVLVNIMLTAPFSFWLLEGFFDSIPRELEEAALIDGASRFQVNTKVILPLIRPGLATVVIYSFVMSWTEYSFSSVLVIDPHLKTLPLGVADVLAQYNIDWSLLTATTSLAMVPGIIFFALAGKHFISGLVSGALKA
jgi:ABC-type glycerol-3-phosphate transport system permease component